MTVYDETYKAGRYDTGVIRGDTWRRAFAFTRNGAAFDLTGAMIKIQLRKTNGELVAEYNNNSGVQIAANVMIWEIDEQQTKEFDIQKMRYDIEIEKNGDVRTYIEGRFNVIQDVTHE